MGTPHPETTLIPLLTALLLAAPSTANSPEGYAAVRRGAERVDNLVTFVERYVGTCKDVYTRAECERNVAAARRAVEGKVLVARVADGVPEIVRARSDGERWRIDVNPFVDAGGLGLTNGAPLKADDQGRPLIGLVVLEGRLPPGTTDLEFNAPFRTGNVEMEIVFTVQGTWKMKRRDGGFYEGVKARFLGLRLVDPRTGAEIASRAL
jgi:hypothetical protein